MKRVLFFSVFFLFLGCGVRGQQQYVTPDIEKSLTPFEKSGKTATATYEECRDYYRYLHQKYPEITFLDSWNMDGESKPVFIFRIYSGTDPSPLKILVMNNIHPGEPEGTDASMLLARELLGFNKDWVEVQNHIDLTIICQYNVDGTINRGCCSRANQNGPAEHGFRGTNMNLDLNRDFIKCDSRNSLEFARMMAKNKYHIFIDNHTSNGADYQYTLTWFHTRPEKLHPSLVPGLEWLSGELEQRLDTRGIPTSPYVDTKKQIPDSGIVAFWESPRYSTGFAALHHCLGFTVETHMWKPFADRVEVTRSFMEEILKAACDEKWRIAFIQQHKKMVLAESFTRGSFEKIQWKLNESRADTILFLGYKSSMPIHPLTGLPLLYYNRREPIQIRIPYYRYYETIDSVKMPRLYIIPAAWKSKILPRLEANGIKVKYWPVDTMMKMRVSYVKHFETTRTPYEAHYLHYNTLTRDTLMSVQIHAGDMAIRVTDATAPFLAAVLEPRSTDSYFNWGLFDAVLQQKEWFSDYVWADKAMEILNENADLKREFENKKKSDSAFASSNWEQLAWVYRHSGWYEDSHNRVPVFRLD